MEENYLVYKHTSPSGKVYVGITKRSVHERWEGGKGYRKNPYFYNAIEKYGWENIQHEVLISGLSYEDAEWYERYFISFYQSFNPKYGYNMTYGGDHGLKITDEIRNKISEKLKDYYASNPDAKKEMSKRMLGKRHSEETKMKMSESHKANMTDEYRAKLSNSQKGVKRKFHHRKPLSKESCKKISDAKKGKHFGGRGITPKKVVCVETGVVYNGVSDICKLFGYKFQNIYMSCNTGVKRYGYTWQYADEYTNREVVKTQE